MVLFWQWNAFMQRGMERALKRLNVQYETYYDCASDWDNDSTFASRFSQKLKGGEYECVLSVNFMPIISDICEESDIPYISWVYDSPVHIRRLETMNNSCNRIYFFDRSQAEHYRSCGVEGARHLPLAADPAVFCDGSGEVSQSEYECDVAFLGQLYRSEYSDLCRGLSQYNRGYLEGIIGAQSQLLGGFIIDEMLSDSLVHSLNEDFKSASEGKFTADKRELSYTIAKEVTGRQRFTALALLQSRFGVDVYSNDTDKRLSGVRFRGYADYYTQMPHVFRTSRINLNISLCTIESGIPLRVLDIMACGGFVLTNAQPEIMEYFTDGEDLAVYEDMKDLVMKAQYYLQHDEERRWIAKNGHEKILEQFGFDDKIRCILG